MLAACSFDGTVSIWELTLGEDGGDAAEFECVATLEGHQSEVKGVSWSNSGKLLATASRDKTVWVWEADKDNEWECLSVLSGHSQDVKMVLFHPTEDYIVSASYDNTLKIWSEEEDDWYNTETITDHSSTAWSLAFNETGTKLVTGGDDKAVFIYEADLPSADDSAQSSTTVAPSTYKKRWQRVSSATNLHDRCIYSVDWSPRAENDCIATAGADDVINVLRLSPDKAIQCVARVENAHDGDVNCVRWNPVQPFLLASGGDDFAAKLWKVIL